MNDVEEALKEAWRDGYETAVDNLKDIAERLETGSPVRTALLLAASLLRVSIVVIEAHDRRI